MKTLLGTLLALLLAACGAKDAAVTDATADVAEGSEDAEVVEDAEVTEDAAIVEDAEPEEDDAEAE